MIESFKHKGLAQFFDDDDRRKLPASPVDKIGRILARLNEAMTVQDMGLPGYRLHPLKGACWFLVCHCIRQLAHHYQIRKRERLRCGSSGLSLIGVGHAHEEPAPPWPVRPT